MARAISSCSADGRRRTASTASSRSFVMAIIYDVDGFRSSERDAVDQRPGPRLTPLSQAASPVPEQAV
jgi:hypothetical protein